MNLYDIYINILSDNEKWNPTFKSDIEHEIDTIFNYPRSYNFIVELLWGDSNLRPLVFDINKIKNCVSQLRINHTISLYLLGIAIAETIGFERFDLPNWDSNPRRNFLHHWLAVCLFHDIGYAVEDYYINEKLTDVRSLDCLSQVLGLSYRLDLLKNSNLLRKYYDYRIKERKKADHGIVGAMILYDSLMTANEKKKNIEGTAIIFSEKPITGNSILRAIELFSNSIAKHNMWFAPEGKEKMYSDYGLNEIVPKKDGSHLISFDQDSMLYLLCLADTIEPLKIHQDMVILEALQQVDIEIEMNDKAVIVLSIKGECSDVLSKMSTLTKWLKCSYDDKKACLRFNLNNTSRKDTQT